MAQVRQEVSDLGHLASVQRFCGDQDAAPAQVEPLPDGLGPESREERAEDTPVLEGSYDRHVEVGHARQQHVHPSACRHAQPVQSTGEAARAVGQLAVAQVVSTAVTIHASQGDMVMASSRRVAVHCFMGDVEPAAVWKPVERPARHIPRERGTLGRVVGHVGNDRAGSRALADRLPRHDSTPYSPHADRTRHSGTVTLRSPLPGLPGSKVTSRPSGDTGTG